MVHVFHAKRMTNSDMIITKELKAFAFCGDLNILKKYCRIKQKTNYFYTELNVFYFDCVESHIFLLIRSRKNQN